MITETDGMDQPGKTSREADKVSQIVARTRAWGNRARIFMECTVSTEGGRTWREYKGGSNSQIVLPCPHCKAWVAPERDHLAGWQEAQSQAEARRTASFYCPSCGQVWSDEDRATANRQCRLLHAGQTINTEGEVEGSLPETDTLGFRWSAVHNLFLSPGEIGGDEWRASRASDEEIAEREMRQFVWCLPVVPSRWMDADIAAQDIAARIKPLPRGIVPHDAKWLTMAVDLGKYLDHWVVVAWSPGPFAHVVDYGRIEVPTGDLSVEQASIVALRQLKELALAGWPRGTSEGEKVIPEMIWVDAGYMTDVVYAFCRESKKGFHSIVGRGVSQQRQQWYNRPTSTGSVVKQIGEGYHVNWIQASGVYLIEINSDHWKTFVHQRLCSPVENPGSMTLFQAPPQEHLALAKHLTAEVKVEEFVAGKGVMTRWERKRKNNHWLDALYIACAAGHWCGVRMVEEIVPEKKPAQAPQPARRTRPERPWFDHERWEEMNRRFWQRRGW